MAPVVTWKYRLHFKLQYKPTENADKAARELRRNFIIFLEDWKKKHPNISLNLAIISTYFYDRNQLKQEKM